MALKLPENLTEQRKKMGLTQQNIADIFSLDRSSYSYYETGKTSPSIETLVKLARMFGTSVEDLIGTKKQSPIADPILNDDPSFTFKKGSVTKADISYKRVMGKLLELTPEELALIDQEIEKILKNNQQEIHQ